MPALTNLKLEAFAQGLARGSSPLEAAVDVGYANDKKSADKRMASPKLLPEPEEPLSRPMTREEWLRTFNPEAWRQQYGPGASIDDDATASV